MYFHLRTIKTFVDVVSLRSFSRAAAENGVSQPSVSQTVQSLEEQFGVRLIDRSHRPFELTPEGRLFYRGARTILRRYDLLVDRVRMLQKEIGGTLRVVSIYSVGLGRLTEFVQRFMAEHPAVKVRLELHPPARVVRLVEADRAHIGIVSYPVRTRRIRVSPWVVEPIHLVTGPAHPLAQREILQSSDLDGLPMVGFEPSLRIREEIDRRLDELDVSPQLMMELDNIEIIKRAIEAGNAAALLPLPTIEREIQLGTLVTRPVSDLNLERPLGIISRAGTPQLPTAREFVRALLKEIPGAGAISSPERRGRGADGAHELDGVPTEAPSPAANGSVLSTARSADGLIG